MAADTLPPGAYEAAASAGPGAPDPLLAGLLAAAPLIREQERERIARCMEALAANYPEDAFTPAGTSSDAIGGTAMRHAYRNAARTIREGEPEALDGGWLAREFREAEREYEALPEAARPVVVRSKEQP